MQFSKRQGEDGADVKTPPAPVENHPEVKSPEAQNEPPSDERWQLSRRRQIAIMAAVALLHVVAVWLTMGGIGLAWDEPLYYRANQSTVIWLSDFLTNSIGEGGSSEHWRETWEYLAVPRIVHGISGWLFSDTWFADRHLLSPIVAQRMLNGVAHGVNIWLIGMMLLRFVGFGPALAGMLAYGSIPRVFGYAHLATTETLMVTMMLLVVVAFMSGLHLRRAALATGVLFGLALNTKFNLILLPIALWLWAWWYHRRHCVNVIMSMTFIAPVVWILTWPWAWSDTAPKIVAYFNHFLGHVDTSVYFHETRWGWDALPAPWYYPIEMAVITMPIPTLLLALLGLYLCIRDRGERAHAHLFAILAVFPLVVSALPNAPKYDGVRLFLTAFAALALVVGVGVKRLHDLLLPTLKRASVRQRFSPVFYISACAVLALPGWFAIASVHPHELSHWNLFVGGIGGRIAQRYETAHWCESVNEEVIEHINETLPEGATVQTVAISPRIFPLLQEWGVVRGDLQFSSHIADPEYFVAQNRQGMLRLREMFLWSLWETDQMRRFGWPRGAEEPDVAMVMVCEGGEEFEEASYAFQVDQLGAVGAENNREHEVYLRALLQGEADQ